MRVTLNGIVAADDDVEIYQWFGFAAFSPKAVRDAVASTPEGEELVLEINSGGGSVFAGSEIYSVLRSSGIHTVAERFRASLPARPATCASPVTRSRSPRWHR